MVSQPDYGKISLIRPNGSGEPLVSDFVTGLRRPHDIVFHTIGSTTYVYISETHQINRFIYNYADTTPHNRELIVTNLPDGEINGELRGAHNHALKNIAIDSKHNLYVSNASATNASVSDTVANPQRGAIYVYDAGATNVDANRGRLFARGLRNAEGLALLPNTDDLWVVVNNRDNVPYPHHGDFDGDGSDDYGKILPAYVDNHPPEAFTRVRDGGNYGWPFANPRPDSPSGLSNMPFDPDYTNNPNWSVYPESAFDRITKGIQAHSAPLGLSFLQNTNFPAAYRTGAVVGYHGSWNRTGRTGYKVTYFPWNASSNTPGDEVDFVTGWVNEETQDVWGRPVDAIADPQGNLFISDDEGGTVYKLTYAKPLTPFAVTTFTLLNADTDQPIAGFDPLRDGATIDLTALPTANLSIRANTSPTTVGSVRFAYDGNDNYKIENFVPYTIAGDNGPDYWPWTLTGGSHTLIATPYSEAQLGGTAGTPHKVSFRVEEGVKPQSVTSFTLLNADTEL